MAHRLLANLSALAALGAAVATAACGAHAAPDGFNLQADRKGEPIEVGRTASGRYLAARHAETVGDIDAAARLTEGLLSDLGENRDLQRRAYLLLISAGRYEAGETIARRFVVENPGDPVARLVIATGALEAGDFDEAIAQIDRIEPTGANRILGPLLRAWALAGKGAFAEADAVLAAFAETPGLMPVARLHAALVADLSGDADRAMTAYEAARTAAAGQVSLQLVESYASFLMRQGRPEEAKALFAEFEAQHERSLLLEPLRATVEKGGSPARAVPNAQAGAAEALHAVASLLDREQMNTQGLLLVRMALHLRPDNPPAQYLLAQLLESDQQPALAIAAYGGIDPSTPFGWFARLNVADIYQRTERSEQAVAMLGSMIDERPDRPDAARALGDVLRIERDFEGAVKAYDRAVERAGGEADWRLLYTRGIALERSKQWARAERDFLKALELEPDQPLVLNYLGYSWVEQGTNLERAKEMIERAVAQRPEDGFITDSLGWVLYRLGDYPQAVTLLERAVALEPSDPVINDHLGDAYWLVGRKLEARFQWSRALSLQPEEDLEGTLRAKLDGREQPKPLPPGERRDI